MKTRYSFGGDEHLFVECDEEMSLEAFFKSLSMTNAVRDSKSGASPRSARRMPPSRSSSTPDIIKPDDILREVQSIESAAEKAEPVIDTRIIEIPVFYKDPWTHETLMRFRERHQDPNGTDLEYAARINGYATRRRFHRRAFRLALVRVHGRLRRRPAVHVPDGRAASVRSRCRSICARAPTRRS